MPAGDGGVPADGGWEADLTAAFTVLLGHPPDVFDPAADYALYYRNTVATHEVFGRLADVGSLARVLSAADDGSRHEMLSLCLDLGWGLDLARSEFEFDFVEEPALGRAFDSLPDSTFRDQHRMVLLGSDLAAVLADHQLGPDDILAGLKVNTVSAAVTLRVATDGTLADAMLTATRTGAGPDRLRPDDRETTMLPFAAGVFTDDGGELSPGLAGERDRVLAPIRDPRLRAHVWTPYLDMSWARSDHGTLTGAAPLVRWTTITRRPTTVFAVAWDLAYYGEVSLAVVQNGGRPPGSS